MSFALSAAVTGLQAHQKMLDIAGNTFSELLSDTIKEASQPMSTIGVANEVLLEPTNLNR